PCGRGANQRPWQSQRATSARPASARRSCFREDEMAAVHKPFLFATGIEGSYPTIAGPDGATVRVDEMARAGHYERWREDFALVKEIGCNSLRWGPPYY